MYSAHNECYSHEIAAVEEAAKEYEEEDKNYVRGFVGALIGGIMSSIPWILVRISEQVSCSFGYSYRYRITESLLYV